MTKLTCEDCNAVITNQPYTDHHYDDENHVYTNDKRVICQKCGYDNYLENLDIELEDGTRVKKI